MNLPSGIVTFLFTDIEGSTKLIQEHTYKMRALHGMTQCNINL